MMPREFLRSLIPRFETRWAVIRLHLIPAAVIVSVVMSFYYLQRGVPAGWATYGISSLALFLLAITALARLNMIAHEKTAARWQMRRFGLLAVGVACLWLIGAPLRQWLAGGLVDFPSWYECLLRIGMFFVWMTTPMMPPWDRFMSGKYRKLVVEVGPNTLVEVERTPTMVGSEGMFADRRRSPSEEEEGP